MYRVLWCDSCLAVTVDDGSAGGWFVFTADDGAGNARCPDCLPDQPGSVTDLARL